MLRRCRRWTLPALTVVLLTALLPTGSPLADHDRTDGTWESLVEWQEVQIRHHNPWVCTNPPNSGPPTFTELDCQAFSTYPYVYQGATLGSSAPRGGLVVTSCVLDAGVPRDCGHAPPSSQWSFAGSNHAIHLADVTLRFGWLCPASAGGWGFRGATYDANGHKTGTGPGPETCGTFTPNQLSISVSGASVTEGSTAVVTITATGAAGSGSVQYATQDGTATAGSDYASQTGVHTFTGPGTRQVTIATIDDSDIESAETFTVQLSNASGVSISVGSATVAIGDNDSARTCPAGQTGTPPNCVPIVTLTGCNAPDTRLSSLTVTAAGSNILTGFSATTYSYAVSAEAASMTVAAAAATGSATVQIGRDASSTGSASRTVHLSEGSTSNPDVTVAAGGESCTYSLAVSRTSGPATDCPAYSGQELVGGVCVDACPGATLIPQFDSDGQVTNCLALGNCPYDQYGFDPLTPFPHRNFGPLWQDAPPEATAVAVGTPGTFTRTVARCSGIFRTAQYWVIDHCASGGSMHNIHPDGDCIEFTMTVQAVLPATNRRFTSTSCNNRYYEVRNTWTAADAVCTSSGGSWTGADPPPAGLDPGTWSVALDTDNFTQHAGSSDPPFVDVPVEVSVTDWGDASHLQVTIIAESPSYQAWRRPVVPGGPEVTFWYSEWRGHSNPHLRHSISVRVPRRSGPPPTNDTVEVSVADTAELGVTFSSDPWCFGCVVSDHRFVKILRSHLLANDACPIGTDCTDPHQWPMRLAGPHADKCNGSSPHGYSTVTGRNQYTAQGAVGCDRLNITTDPLNPADIRYWPQLWAHDTDTFTYETYGGFAEVQINFTDRPPDAGTTTVYDPGTAHTAADYTPRTVNSWELVQCTQYSWGWFGGQVCVAGTAQSFAAYQLSAPDFTALHHTGSWPIADPDGDAHEATFRDGHNPHLTGRLTLPSGGPRTGWRTTETTPVVSPYGVGNAFIRELHNSPVNPTTGTTHTVIEECGASTVKHYTGRTTTWAGALPVWTWPSPGAVKAWSAATATDPACRPATPTSCTASPIEAVLCWAVWPHTADPDPLVVDYRACDKRYGAYEADSLYGAGSKALAAGRTDADYCADGTLIVVLGDLPTVTIAAAPPATEGTPLQFPVSLDEPAAADVTVTFSTQPDTAGTDPAEASDYLAVVGGTVTIPAGLTQATAYVFTTQDSIYEDDETLRVVLTGADFAQLGATTEAVGTIEDDDSPPTLGAADVAATEDDGTNGGSLTFTVELTGDTELQAQVTYATADGTATSVSICQPYPGSAAEDYLPAAGTLTFAPGDTSKTITVNLCPDDQTEGDETLEVTLSSPTNADLGDPDATGTILDNELTPLQQCEALHGPGWSPVLYPDGTPWTDSGGQIVCAMPH